MESKMWQLLLIILKFVQKINLIDRVIGRTSVHPIISYYKGLL